MRPAALATAAAALGGMSLLGGVSGGSSSSSSNGHAGLTTMSAAAATTTASVGGGGGGSGGGNALLEQDGLPKFAKIAPEAVVPAIRQLSQVGGREGGREGREGGKQSVGTLYPSSSQHFLTHISLPPSFLSDFVAQFSQLEEQCTKG